MLSALVLCAGQLHAAAASTPEASADASAGPAYCRFTPPAEFPSIGVTWSGACERGLAQGLGTLRAYGSTVEDGKRVSRVLRSYYGKLQDGQAVLGVVEVPDEGFIAGRFKTGQHLNDGDRNTMIQAFETAALAAQELAARLRQAGNAASARYYDRKAAELSQQLD